MALNSGEEPQLIDLLHLGRPQVIGSWRVGDIVIDPGPASCLEQLLPVLEEHPPRVIALTHIHLDHAGAAGSLARRFPEAEVWVHERGARHMADPSRLLASATRLYGENMERLWGEFLPVPQERLRVLNGGESLGPLRVAYTPGHASHHVSYLHEETGWAFTGDVAGVRIATGPTIAPTPPPDIDLPAWRASLELIEGWRPEALAITHLASTAMSMPSWRSCAITSMRSSRWPRASTRPASPPPWLRVSPAQPPMLRRAATCRRHRPSRATPAWPGISLESRMAKSSSRRATD